MASPSSDFEVQRPPMVFRILLAGTVVLAGLAVASPGRPVAPAQPQVACAIPASDAGGQGSPGLIVLPPGHPPIRGLGPQGQPVVTLPPGHPPIQGPVHRQAPPLPAGPPLPLFAPPATVDL